MKPNPGRMRAPTQDRVKAFIEGEEIRGRIRQDGGDIRFEGMKGVHVSVCLGAACASCPSASRLVEHFVGPKLRERFGETLSVTARKEKPYFRR